MNILSVSPQERCREDAENHEKKRSPAKNLKHIPRLSDRRGRFPDVNLPHHDKHCAIKKRHWKSAVENKYP